ncbi:MAG TPA: HlyC/CorC family transporter, partial [Thermodesulfobacteriaceae bacterium]|nr:HlyC/CorC family transporter [Thermodesulfobacteriaceae bacterium]
HLVEKAYLSGALGPQERLFIYSLFESEETPVSAIMTPRKDIFALEDQEITENLLHTLKETPFHKIPIYREHLDKVVGVLYVQDLLKARLHTDIHKLSELSRPAFFVPEKTRVRKLLEEFQRRRIKMALVVDEYGHISGLVTLEDVLEELFGEIYQARESKEPLIEKLGEGIYRVKGRVQIEDFNRETGAHLPAEGFRTMAGLALHLFQELPKEGDEAKGYGFRFQVERIQKNRIESLIVERLEKDEAHL